MKSILLGDWGTKATALLLSVLVWVVLYSGSGRREIRNVSLRLMVPDATVNGAPIAWVRLRYGGREIAYWVAGRGAGDHVLPLAFAGAYRSLARVADPLAVVSIPRERMVDAIGRFEMELPADAVRGVSPDVAVSLSEGGTLEVKYATYEVRELPIQTQGCIQGRPAAGLEVRSVEAIPERIRVLVPADESPTFVLPARLDVTGFDSGFTTPPWTLAPLPGRSDDVPPIKALDEFRLRVRIGLPENPPVRALYVRVKGVFAADGPVANWRLEQGIEDSLRIEERPSGTQFFLRIVLRGPEPVVRRPWEDSAYVVIDMDRPAPPPDERVNVKESWIRFVVPDPAQLRGVEVIPLGHIEDPGRRSIAVTLRVAPEPQSQNP